MSKLGIEDLEIGISAGGMKDYMNSLQMNIKDVNKAIDNFTDTENAIRGAWQGVACDKFIKDFKKTREDVKADMQKEYKDVENRLAELRNNYYKQDQNMY